MDFRILNVPTCSTSEVKKSPGAVFEQAEREGAPVYVFNHNEVAGVMMTQQQYESLVQELTVLREMGEESMKKTVRVDEKEVVFLLEKYSDNDGNMEYYVHIDGDDEEIGRATKQPEMDYEIEYYGKIQSGEKVEMFIDGYRIRSINKVLKRLAEVYFYGKVTSD